MGLLSSLGLPASRGNAADKAKGDSLKAQYGKDFKSAVVLATKVRDPKAKAELAEQLKAADADKRRADAMRSPGERAQAMQAALDKVNNSAAKAQESQASQSTGTPSKAPAPARVGEKVEVRPKQGEKVQGPNAAEMQAAKPQFAPPKVPPAPQGAGSQPTPTTGQVPDVQQAAHPDAAKTKKDSQGSETVTAVKHSQVGGVDTTQVDVDRTEYGDGSVTKTHSRDVQRMGPGGIAESSSKQTATVGKDGVEADKEQSVEMIDAAGRHTFKKKTHMKAGKDGVSTSDSFESVGQDGSRDIVAKDVDVGTADGKGVVVHKKSNTHVDAAGNRTTVKVTKTTVTDKDGKVSSNATVAVEQQSAAQAAAEKKRLEEAQRERAEEVKTMQASMAAAKSTAMARGNRLYKLFQADTQRTAAGQAHNRGMARLKSGDASAAQVAPGSENLEAAYAAAVDAYNAAAQAFAEGMAMFGEGVRPVQNVPESGGA